MFAEFEWKLEVISASEALCKKGKRILEGRRRSNYICIVLAFEPSQELGKLPRS